MQSQPSSAELIIQLIDEIQRARGRLMSLSFSEPKGPTGLGMTILSAVVLAAYPPTVPQIGRSLGYPRQTVQRHAEDLAARGLISFIDNPDHKRALRLVATGDGKAMQDKATQKSLVWAAALTRDLDPQRLAETVGMLKILRTRIEADIRNSAADTKADKNNQDRE
jgi:DNA-binding MarR family transcriptional regulator